MYKLLSGSLLALPFVAHAQAPTAVISSPKYYVGVGANAGWYYDKQHGENIKSGLQYSPSIVAGIQLSPRLAVQLSALTTNYRSSYTAQSIDYNPDAPSSPPNISYISGTTSRRYYILPLLGRYTLSANSKRLKLDGLFGATVYHTRERNTTTYSDSQFRVLDRYGYSRTATYGNLAIGAGLRYALAPQLELASELRGNLFYFGYFGRLIPNLDVSVRYCFGSLTAKSASGSTTPSFPAKTQ